MKRYFYLQLKRGLRVFPFILLTALIILTSVVTVFLAVQSRMQNGEENQRFKIAITGDLDDKYSRLGLAVLQNFDDTRFAIDLTEMTALWKPVLGVLKKLKRITHDPTIPLLDVYP